MNAVFAVARLLVLEIFRKKDAYVAFLLMAVILVYAAGMDFYDERNVVRYLLELGLSLVFFFSVILTAALGARQVPAEREARTLPVLLAKPIRRSEFVAGKFLGTFLAGAAAFTLFYGFFLGVASFKGGVFSAATAGETYLAFLLNLWVLAAVASGLSYFLTSSAGLTLTVLVYFLMNTYGPALKAKAGPFLYFTLPHFEFFDLRQRLVHGWGGLPGDVWAALAAYAFLYALVPLSLGAWRFARENA